jgi:flagellar biosynthesis GTPase FlhF
MTLTTPVPEPAATEPTGQPAPATTPEQVPAQQPTDDKPEAIRDPEAWARSQVEKAERLKKKAEEQAAELAQKIAAMETQQQESIRQAVQQQQDAIKAELEQLQQDAAAAKVEAARVKAMAEAGLPAEMAEFVTATEPDAIKAQVEKLSKATLGKSKTGNTTEPAGTDLSWLTDRLTGRNTFGDGGVMHPEKR